MVSFIRQQFEKSSIAEADFLRQNIRCRFRRQAAERTVLLAEEVRSSRRRRIEGDFEAPRIQRALPDSK